MTSSGKYQKIIEQIAQGEWLEVLEASVSDTQLEIRQKHLKLSQEFNEYPEIQNALNQALAMAVAPGAQMPSQIVEPWLEELVIPKVAVQSPLSDTSKLTSSQDYPDMTTLVIPAPQRKLTQSLITERIVLICCSMLVAFLFSLSQMHVIAPLVALIAGSIVIIVGFVFFLALFCKVSDLKKKRTLLRELLDIKTRLHEAEKAKTLLPIKIISLEREEQEHLVDLDSQWCESNQKAKHEVNTNHETLQRLLDGILINKQGLSLENETKHILAKKQANYLKKRFMKWTLIDAEIPGIGADLKRQLMLVGIRNAADFVDIAITVSYYNFQPTKITHIILASGEKVRVPGIGPKKASSLLEWRKNIESLINIELPQSLSNIELQSIQQGSYNLSQLNDQEDQARQQFDVRKKQIILQCQQQHMDLRKQFFTYQESCTINLQNLKKELEENSLLLCHQRQIFNTKSDELSSCVKVTFFEYIKKVLTLWS